MFISAWFFVRLQDRSHQLAPYPLIFHSAYEATRNYPRFSCTSISNCLEERAFGKCLVSAPCTEIKLEIYYDSIKQQERNYFRQLKLLRSEIYEPASRRSTCLLTPSTCCRNQTGPKKRYRYNATLYILSVSWHKDKDFATYKKQFLNTKTILYSF